MIAEAVDCPQRGSRDLRKGDLASGERFPQRVREIGPCRWIVLADLAPPVFSAAGPTLPARCSLCADASASRETSETIFAKYDGPQGRMLARATKLVSC